MLPLSVSKDAENPPPASDLAASPDEPDDAPNPGISEQNSKAIKLFFFGLAFAIFAHAPPKRLMRASSLPSGILDAYIAIFSLVFVYGLVLLACGCVIIGEKSLHTVRVFTWVTIIVLPLCGCLGAAAIVLSFVYE